MRLQRTKRIRNGEFTILIVPFTARCSIDTYTLANVCIIPDEYTLPYDESKFNKQAYVKMAKSVGVLRKNAVVISFLDKEDDLAVYPFPAKKIEFSISDIASTLHMCCPNENPPNRMFLANFVETSQSLDAEFKASHPNYERCNEMIMLMTVLFYICRNPFYN